VGRIRHLSALVRGELRALRTERATGGVGHAVRQRVAHHAGVPALRAAVDTTAADVKVLHERLEAAERRHAESEHAAAELRARVDAAEAAAERDRAFVAAVRSALDQRLGGITQRIEELGQRVAALQPLVARADALDRGIDALHQKLHEHHPRLAELERALAVRSFTDWLEQASLGADPLITVVLPTRNRAAMLPRAIASVQAQVYPNWELVIVDDESTDATPEVLEATDDPRVRSLRVPHGGCCAARNAALDVAKGEIVAYLDDDNTMHPLWLKALAWAFTERPEVDVLYGAFVVDDVHRIDQQGSGAFPRLFLHPYDRAHLEQSNVADMGAIAHRAGLPEARFDESLVEMGDWDLLCRLTAERDPLVLPAVACFYSTDAPNRLSCGPTHGADYTTIRARNEARQAVHQ
jgi:Glycosyl transferase family 2